MRGDLAAALERLQRLHPKRIDLSLDRMIRLLQALGDPQERVPPVVHVAGTNGKGSAVAFLRACLEAAGYRVHAYTSPHLVRFNERIRLGGQLIADDLLADVLLRSETVNGDQPITYFEVTTAAAFLAFAEVPADLLLLEVGLGGRLDATNVIDRPLTTAITRISMDHTQFLGNSLTSIAREKAGIMKRGVPVVIGPQPAGEVAVTLAAAAEEAGALPAMHSRDWSFAQDDDGFALTIAGKCRRLPAPVLPGRHQIANAATALVCLEHLTDFPVPEAAMHRGLAAVDWPGRLQRLTRGPMVSAMPPDWELWLDGGHNDSAGEALRDWLAEGNGRPTHLVVGMLKSKDPVDFLAPMAGRAASLYAVPISGEPGSSSADALAAAARAAGYGRVATAAAPEEAVRILSAAPGADGPARLLICGSLYLAGQVLRDHA